MLCMNLWGLRKKHGQVLLVNIAGAATASDAAGSSADPVALLAASASEKSHVLAAEDAATSHVLKNILAEANRKAAESGAPNPPIVRCGGRGESGSRSDSD